MHDEGTATHRPPADWVLPDYVVEARKRHPRAYERWTEPEEQQILHLVRDGYDISDIAELTKRPHGAIRNRLLRLGVTEIGGHPIL